MYFILVGVSLKKDLRIFMNFGTLGSVCVCTLIVFVIYEGILGLTETNFNVVVTEGTSPAGDFDLALFSGGFSALMGTLCTGYFIHQCSLPIIENAAEPAKNYRNVFLGYLAVFITYCIVGNFGYIGFTGTQFE